MKVHSTLVAAGLLLALAACGPVAAEYTESEAPKQLTLDNATVRVGVRFAPGSSRLAAGDAARLRRLAAGGSISPSDRVRVSAAGGPALAAARVNAIAAELLHYGILATSGSLGAAPANRAIIETGRYLATLPPCPDWSKPASVAFTNTVGSNFGCATAVNFARMVASPADLAEGRPVGPVDAIPAAAAVQRYLADKVRLPSAANIGPISAPSSGATVSGSTGAGSAGSTP
jgi:pilus assembly protein CpaD